MQLGIALSKIDQLKAQAKQIHQLAVSNDICSKPAATIFKKFDGKLTSVSKSIEKMRGFEPGDYDYVAPKANSILGKPEVTKTMIKNQLKEFKAKLEIFQGNWKEEGYKVVNPQTNKIDSLNNTNRGNVTKSIKDIEDLVSKF